MIREIVKIDETLCDGCGQCVPTCHEGALQIIDGKARLISELMCDGLGACLGHCPQNAITIEKREAEEYDEKIVLAKMINSGKATVFAHLKHLKDHNELEYLNQALTYIKLNHEKMPFSIRELHEYLHGKKDQLSFNPSGSHGCPGSKATSLKAKDLKYHLQNTEIPTALTQWPVQLHLINPAAGYFQEADVLIAADCTAFAYGNFHQKFLTGRKLVIACPKLDDGKEIYIRKINRLIDEANIKSITAVIMEVPCCGGITGIIKRALEDSERQIQVKVIIISIEGIIKDEYSF